ncbi:tryptase-like [Denticeps clupeoides]|uniref:tryptase-like n=1 Tax=Denticeps clupeoides TaxID=299321 RepID=UPI0010A4D9D7|nr:tryptase-like [Denticeps clupeoides]
MASADAATARARMKASVCLLTSVLVAVAQGCGQAPLNTRIVGGQDAGEGAWPWPAISSLIPPFDVYLGQKTLQCSDPNEKLLNVSQIIVHTSYQLPVSNNNDIALLKLSSFVTFSNYIQLICLAAGGSVFPDGTSSWVTGWANINWGVSLPYPKNLQEVEVPIVSNSKCQSEYESRSITGNCQNCCFLSRVTGSLLVCKQCSIWIQPGFVLFLQCCCPKRAHASLPTCCLRCHLHPLSGHLSGPKLANGPVVRLQLGTTQAL